MRRWNLAQIGSNSHPRKVRRWWRATGFDPLRMVELARQHGRYDPRKHVHPRDRRIALSLSTVLAQTSVVEHPAGKAEENLAREGGAEKGSEPPRISAPPGRATGFFGLGKPNAQTR